MIQILFQRTTAIGVNNACNRSIIGIAGSKGAPGTLPPWRFKSFIFMQFSAKKLKNNSNFGSWRTPLGKILDPPLIAER